MVVVADSVVMTSWREVVSVRDDWWGQSKTGYVTVPTYSL